MERNKGKSKTGTGSFMLGNSPARSDPFEQFAAWFRKAGSSSIPEYTAMHLATTGKNGRPSGRMVLLKSFDEKGFVFYTNYESTKGKAIGENPYVALTFYWNRLGCQVRIEGKAERVSSAESDKYFATRSPESRAGAVASPQSKPVPDRQYLDKIWKEVIRDSPPEGPARPAHWGGFRVKPLLFEFWKQGEHRLHDRVRYLLVKGKWVMERLAP